MTITIALFLNGSLAYSHCSNDEDTSFNNPPDYGTVTGPNSHHIPSEAQPKTGILSPLVINEYGEDAELGDFSSARTDVNPSPETEIPLQVGASDNKYSADCTGGYFQVGAAGSQDFGSASGTISLWLKWDTLNPSGRFWGQDYDFETRWSGNALVLDWGGDISLTGVKTDWLSNHWYFIAITWNENTDTLRIFWGDEISEPILDVETTIWTSSVIGYHLENNIMNSAGRSDQVDGHIDDFRYFNVERTLNDLRSDYNKTISPTTTGLQNHYEFENSLRDSKNSIHLSSIGNYGFSFDVISAKLGWRAEQVAFEVRNLQRLYALNGTFNQGVEGTNIDWTGDGLYFPLGWNTQRETSSTNGRQLSSYYGAPTSMIELENEGYTYSSPLRYRHYDNTRIFFYQVVDNGELNENFAFSFNYLYERGPIGTSYDGYLELKAEVRDGTTVLWEWTIDPTSITQRGVWFSSGQVSASIPSAPSSFEFRVCLEIDTPGSYIDFYDSNADLDGDPANGKFVAFLIDDVSFVGAAPPSFSAINLTTTLPAVGETSMSWNTLVNYSFWDVPSIIAMFSSDAPISFEFRAHVSKMSRIQNSSYSTNPLNTGVGYSVLPGQSSQIELFTYIDQHVGIGNYRISLSYPWDWDNVTIFNAFSADVTNQCELIQGGIEIEGDVLNSLGWWRITLEGPNYAFDLYTERYNSTSVSWNAEISFDANDKIRANTTLGTSLSTPVVIGTVDISWILPNQSIWSHEAFIGGGSPNLVSLPLTLGSLNTSAGIWYVQVFWENGTEVAFESISFYLYHKLVANASNPIFKTNENNTLTASVEIKDLDTNTRILDPALTVFGNWTSTTVFFTPNPGKGLWEGEFNTSLSGTGNFTVVVNAEGIFHTSANCSFVILVTAPTQLTFLGFDYSEVGVGESYDAKFRYEYIDSTGIDMATVEVLSVVGPVGGISWNTPQAVPGESGNYSATFIATLSGTYRITVVAAKIDHDVASTFFILIVREESSQLILKNSSAATIDANSNFNLVVQYLNSSGSPLESATVGIASQTPGTGLLISSTVYEGNGTYSILITPLNQGTFSLVIEATLQNYQSQYAIFTLTVSPIASFLSVDPTSASIAIDLNYTLILEFKNESLYGLEGASISILSVSPSSGVLITEAIDLGSGLYSLTLVPLQKGMYDIVFRASLPKYQNGTATFTLIATEVPTILRTSDGKTSSEVFYNQDFHLLLFYERSDIIQNITLANIRIDTGDGLSYSIVETSEAYYISLQADKIGNWQLLVTASREGYRNATLLYNLLVRENPASIEGTGPETEIPYAMASFFILRYYFNGTTGIEDAKVNITYNPLNSVEWTEIGNGEYRFDIPAFDIGSYSISIVFSKYGYQMVDCSFMYVVTMIETETSCSGLKEMYYESRVYNFALYFNDSNGLGIEAADITPSPEIRPFFSFLGGSSGWYNFTLTPIEGQWNAIFWLRKAGYHDGVYSILLSVSKIPLSLSVDTPLEQTYTELEHNTISVSVRIVANDTGEFVSGIQAAYTVLKSGTLEVVQDGSFVEIDGYYTANITLPSAGLYTLIITIAKQHYETAIYSAILNSEIDLSATLFGALQIGLISGIFLMALVFSSYFGRREYRSMQSRRYRGLLELKDRIEDARNIIALMVIHRATGLPLYRKIIKGGFEESLVSSFITAITQFREELGSEEPILRVIPISEVVSAVLTDHLICALITVDSISPRQSINLEALVRKVMESSEANESDLSLMATKPELSIPLSEYIESEFNIFLDGKLVKTYYGIDAENLPPKLDILLEALGDIEVEEGFTIETLINVLILKGIGEAKAYSIALHASDAGLLLTEPASAK